MSCGGLFIKTLAEEQNMRSLMLPLIVAATLATSGCAEMSDTGRRTTTGAVGGAAAGALIGSFSGDAGTGALIGAGVGAAGGYLYDRSKKQQDAAYQEGYQQGQQSR
jgi:uncharacterized membrane protein